MTPTLQNGNAGTDLDSGKPVIVDPSSYYGHNEAEYVLILSLHSNITHIHRLSIARIFGGFSSTFFTAYHERIPPSEPVSEYPQRGALYELFHYLNHTVLFGVSPSLLFFLFYFSPSPLFTSLLPFHLSIFQHARN